MPRDRLPPVTRRVPTTRRSGNEMAPLLHALRVRCIRPMHSALHPLGQSRWAGPISVEVFIFVGAADGRILVVDPLQPVRSRMRGTKWVLI
jgi:hypothetical protein